MEYKVGDIFYVVELDAGRSKLYINKHIAVRVTDRVVECKVNNKSIIYENVLTYHTEKDALESIWNNPKII